MPKLSSMTLIVLLISTLALSACDWVDSTGIQGAENDGDSDTNDANVGFESATVFLEEGMAVALLENTASTVQLLNDNSSNGIWNWELRAEGENTRCEGIDGFDDEIAETTLVSSCTDPASCEVRVDSSSAAVQGDYIIELPTLMAPVALNYVLSSELSDGTQLEREQIICALSVNEAPTAIDDNYRVITGDTLNVAGTDVNSLLANDIDDIDVRNEPLSVNTVENNTPEFASEFNLLSDGGFIYEPLAQLPFDDDNTLVDSFDYQISDGTHTVIATAIVTITPTNMAPIATGQLPDAIFELTGNETPAPFLLDVMPYFESPDDDTLFYSVDAESQQALPESILVQLGNSGLLDISIDTNSAASAAGTWSLDILASDTLDVVSSTLNIIVELPPRDTNEAPVASDIANQTVEDDFDYDISGFFTDPDGDALTFSSSNLPPDVELSPQGVLSGSSSDRNEGSWPIIIEAQDGYGGSASDGFRLRIR